MPVSIAVTRPSYEPSATPLSFNSVVRNSELPRLSYAATSRFHADSVCVSMPVYFDSVSSAAAIAGFFASGNFASASR